jgi:hypothetical protein
MENASKLATIKSVVLTILETLAKLVTSGAGSSSTNKVGVYKKSKLQ